MNPSSRRVRQLGYGFGAAVIAVFLHLAYLMISQHETWEMRSYGNRWAFRDVPTKRGGIRDRVGKVLVKDVPATALSVYYRRFRRQHPCGTALHAANTARSLAGGTPSFRFSREGVEGAFRECLRLPISLLRDVDADADGSAIGSAVGKSVAADLRFYVCSLFAALTDGASYWQRYRRLRQGVGVALQAGGTRTVCEVLGLPATELSKVFSARLAELAPIVDEMTRRQRDFWQQLEGQRQQYEAARARGEVSRAELVPRVVHRQLSYELARFLSIRREWHPGLSVRPAVERQRTPANSLHGERFESIVPLLGRVTLEWGQEDAPRRAAILEQLDPAIEAMAAVDDELSDRQRQAVQRRLKTTMEYHLAARGLVGRSGVEFDLDPVLRGTAGLQWYLRSRRQREVGLWSNFDVTPGEDVYLAVDLRLQGLAESAIDHALAGVPAADLVAAFAVIDPWTGDILALASRPLPADRVGKARSHPEPCLSWWRNGAIGSLAKPMILLEHLDARRHGRAAGRHEDFELCQGRTPMRAGGPFRRFRLRCDHRHAELVRDCVKALGESCNYFFFQAAEGLGWPGVARAYARFGLYCASIPADQSLATFQRYVPGIPAGRFPKPTWAENRDIQRRAIGYGIAANVLHIARAYAGLATGRLPELSFVRRGLDGLHSSGLSVHADDLRVVRDGLAYCVREGTGSALDLPGVFAKTGTAEVSAKKENNAWFAGYVEADGRPRLAFASVVYYVPNRSYGGKAAGPMIEQFLRELRRDDELRRIYLGR